MLMVRWWKGGGVSQGGGKCPIAVSRWSHLGRAVVISFPTGMRRIWRRWHGPLGRCAALCAPTHLLATPATRSDTLGRTDARTHRRKKSSHSAVSASSALLRVACDAQLLPYAARRPGKSMSRLWDVSYASLQVIFVSLSQCLWSYDLMALYKSVCYYYYYYYCRLKTFLSVFLFATKRSHKEIY